MNIISKFRLGILLGLIIVLGLQVFLKFFHQEKIKAPDEYTAQVEIISELPIREKLRELTYEPGVVIVKFKGENRDEIFNKIKEKISDLRIRPLFIDDFADRLQFLTRKKQLLEEENRQLLERKTEDNIEVPKIKDKKTVAETDIDQNNSEDKKVIDEKKEENPMEGRIFLPIADKEDDNQPEINLADRDLDPASLTQEYEKLYQLLDQQILRLQSIQKKYQEKGLNRLFIISSEQIRHKVLGLENSLKEIRKNNQAENPQLTKIELENIIFKPDKNNELMDSETNELLSALTPETDYVEPNWYYDLTADLSDPYYDQMWEFQSSEVSYPSWDNNLDGDFNDEGENGKSADNINIASSESTLVAKASGGEGMIVAVIDSGVDIYHEDLAKNIWKNSDEIISNGIDDDHNGFIDDLNGYNFSDNNTDLTDVSGHGTHVSGTIAAIRNNGVGITGLAYHAKIMPVRVFPNASDTVVANAIKYAVVNGADVINLSLGKKGASELMKDIIQFSNENNVPCVLAAGNNTARVEDYIPANIKAGITVAAIDSHDEHAKFSNTGILVDIAAPGVDILSLRGKNTDFYCSGSNQSSCNKRIYNNNYYIINGTSMAAPHVSATVALVKKVYPNLNADQISQLIKSTGNQFNELYGYGKINLDKIAQFDSANSMPIAEIIFPANNVSLKGKVEIKGLAYDGSVEKSEFKSWQLRYKRIDSQNFQTLLEFSSEKSKVETLTTFDTNSVPDGEYYLELTSWNNHDFPARDIIKISIDNNYLLSPDPNLFYIFGKEDISVSAHLTSTEKLNYELAYEPDYCAITDEKCWKIINSSSISNKIFDGEIGVWKYNSQEKRKGIYRLRLKTGSNNIVAYDYFSILVDDDLKKGWPIKFSRLTDNKNYYPNLLFPEVADLDNDGNQEIVVTTFSNSSLKGNDKSGGVYLFNSEGKLLPGWPYRFIWSAEWSYLDPQPVAFYDLNQDGKKEIFLVGQTLQNNLPHFLLLGLDLSGKLLPKFPLELFDDKLPPSHYGAGMSRLIINDLNNDKKPEFIYYGVRGDLSVIDSAGEFLPGYPKYFNQNLNSSVLPLNVPSLSPAVFDLNNDRIKDIICPLMRYQNDLYWPEIYAFNGLTGETLWMQKFPANNLMPHSPVVADLNNDKKPEILIDTNNPTKNSSTLSILTADGKNFPKWPKELLGSTITSPLSAGNLDQDSSLEIAASTSTGLQVFKSNGNSKWTQSLWPTQDQPIFTDINNDNFLDIIIGDRYRFNAFNNKGEIIPGWPILIANPSLPIAKDSQVTLPKLADIDKDKKLELILVSGWTMDGITGQDYLLVYDLDFKASNLYKYSTPDLYPDAAKSDKTKGGKMKQSGSEEKQKIRRAPKIETK